MTIMVLLQRTIYKLAMGLPIALPFEETAAELEPYQDSITEKISYMITKAQSGEIRFQKDV